MKIPSLLFIWSFYPTLFIHLTLCIHCIILYLKLCVVCQVHCIYKWRSSWMKFVNCQPWCESNHLWLLAAPNHRSVQAKQLQKGKIWRKKTSNFSKTFYISEQLNFKHIPNKTTEHLWLKPNGFCNDFIYILVNKEKMCYNVLMLVILFTNRRGPMGTRYTPASGHFFILNPTWSSFENHQVSGNPKFSGMPNISGLCAISGLA